MATTEPSHDGRIVRLADYQWNSTPISIALTGLLLHLVSSQLLRSRTPTYGIIGLVFRNIYTLTNSSFMIIANMDKITSEEPDLYRFLCAQDAGTPFGESEFEIALREIEAGEKQSHWIWYIFPQLQGLGASEMCKRFGVYGLTEAKAFLKNDLLRDNLRKMFNALLKHAGRKSAVEILGDIDAKKVQSCATLFLLAAAENGDDDMVFIADGVIQSFYDGRCDERTVEMVNEENRNKKPVQQELF